MKSPRRHRLADVHRDGNENELVKLAAQLGGHWWEGGPLDGWIFVRGVWKVVEIKLPEREGTIHEYTPLQKRFMSWCELHRAPYYVWRDADDVMRTMGATVAA
jgi:hypothetical protein